MALQNNDLFVVQSQTDKKLYSLKVSDLIAEVEASGGVVFKGSVDLNNPPSAQQPNPISLPAAPGDFYMVESDAPAIDSGWVMQNGETEATKGDRIIYDADNADWILITTGSSEAGTMTGITATLPLEEDGDPVEPTISIRQARTSTQAGIDADGKGTAGAVARLAEEADVVAGTGTGSSSAVVTADLLKETNDHVAALELSPVGVTSLTTDDAYGNSALTVGPTTGAVKVEIKTASDSNFGVVQVASASDIANGTSGPSAVIDASQLEDAVEGLPSEAIVTLTEGGTDIVTGALSITTTPKSDPDAMEKDTTIGINKDVFCPYDFSTLTDINA